MRQVNVTSLGDDARETLTIAGLEESKERALEQHLRLRAPQIWTVLCASVDQYLRTTAGSGSQPTPMEIDAVMSTCACCGKGGHEKARCRFRNAKCSNCGKIVHLRAMCRQREKSAGKSSPSNSFGKSSGKGSADKCYCGGQVGHRRFDCFVDTRVAASVASVLIRAKLVDLLVGTQMLGLLRWNPLSQRRREKFNTCGHGQSMTFLDSSWTLCLFATTPISRLTNLVTC